MYHFKSKDMKDAAFCWAIGHRRDAIDLYQNHHSEALNRIDREDHTATQPGVLLPRLQQVYPDHPEVFKIGTMGNDTRIFQAQAVGLKENAESWKRDIKELYNENPWLHGMTNPDRKGWYKLHVSPVVDRVLHDPMFRLFSWRRTLTN